VSLPSLGSPAVNDEGTGTGHLDRHDSAGPDEPAQPRAVLDQIEAALDGVAATLAQMG